MQTSPSELSVKTFVEWYRIHRKAFKKGLRSKEFAWPQFVGLIYEIDDFVADYDQR